VALDIRYQWLFKWSTAAEVQKQRQRPTCSERATGEKKTVHIPILVVSMHEKEE
jgi:hypothetical protein